MEKIHSTVFPFYIRRLFAETPFRFGHNILRKLLEDSNSYDRDSIKYGATPKTTVWDAPLYDEPQTTHDDPIDTHTMYDAFISCCSRKTCFDSSLFGFDRVHDLLRHRLPCFHLFLGAVEGDQ